MDIHLQATDPLLSPVARHASRLAPHTASFAPRPSSRLPSQPLAGGLHVTLTLSYLVITPSALGPRPVIPRPARLPSPHPPASPLNPAASPLSEAARSPHAV